MRKVNFSTKLRLANQRPILFRLVLMLTLFPLVYSFAMYVIHHRFSMDRITDVEFYFFYAPVIPFFSYGLLLSIYFLFALSRQIKLIRSGDIREAELISFGTKPAMALPFAAEKYWIRYRYLIAGDNRVEGQSETTDRSVVESKKSGDKIKIFVSPENEFRTFPVIPTHAQMNGWKLD